MDSSPKKILVVENDELTLVLISHILTRQSYVVHTSLDGAEAAEMLERNDYAAVLLDLKMPHGGVDLIRRIEALNPALLKRIIVVTGALDEAARLSGIPVCAIVKKPFEIHDFIVTVRSCIEREQ